MTDEARTPTVYVDANPFIYFIEGDAAIATRLKPLFELLKGRPGTAMTSELTLAEVLPKAGPDARRNYFNLIVWSNVFRLQPVTREILIDTADYRRVTAITRSDGRKVMLKIPDAIHVVTAARSRCQMFLSADSGLKLPSGMKVFVPDDAGLAELQHQLT
jgi:predicted nucleic acid-binding protein